MFNICKKEKQKKITTNPLLSEHHVYKLFTSMKLVTLNFDSLNYSICTTEYQ